MKDLQITNMSNTSDYIMTGQLSELERLRLQSRVWEPAGRSLLDRLDGGPGKRVLDVGCGAMSWLRILREWVGPNGEVVGSDIDDKMIDAAKDFVETEKLSNVTVLRDDLFDSHLTSKSFDLVHARFQLAPIGRVSEQLVAYRGWLKPGGILVLEDPDSSSWHFNPPAPNAERLIALILESFKYAGGNFDSGRELGGFLRESGGTPSMDAHVLALPPGHPYLRLPLQFAASLEPRLLPLIPKEELITVKQLAEEELSDHDRWGTTFTLIQAWAKIA